MQLIQTANYLSLSLALSFYATASPTDFLYVSNQDGDREIYLSDGSGKVVQQLTNNASEDYLASWSPNGSEIVFTSNRDNGDSEIYVMNADGSNQINISNRRGHDANAVWSPDGEQIVFCSDREGSINLYIVDKKGKNLRRLTDVEVEAGHPTWSPDGQWIAYFEFDRNQKSNVVLISADGAKTMRVTDKPKLEGTSIDWSPDSKKIVYDSRRKRVFDIYKYDLVTGKEYQLTDLSTVDTSPKWSRDGREIVFLSARGGEKNQLFIMGEDGSSPRNLGLPQAQDKEPSISSDGSYISYTRVYESRYPNIFMSSVDGKNVVRLFSEKGYQSQPLFRPTLISTTDNDS
ncbi:hypothetical protein [Vibrio sp. HN007]|uniref:TolB family protein n=1 Tax=Vibrio iocasae TaxID=3098914 RepID=UPI0035D4A60F